jgi:hypothetical protein
MCFREKFRGGSCVPSKKFGENTGKWAASAVDDLVEGCWGVGKRQSDLTSAQDQG